MKRGRNSDEEERSFDTTPLPSFPPTQRGTNWLDRRVPKSIGNDDRRRARARYLIASSLVIAFLALAGGTIRILLGPVTWPYLTVILLTIALGASVPYLLRFAGLNAVSIFLPFSMLAAIATLGIQYGGLTAPALVAFPAVVVLAILAAGRWVGGLVAASSLVLLLLLAFLQSHGLVAEPPLASDDIDLLRGWTLGLVTATITGLVFLSERERRRSEENLQLAERRQALASRAARDGLFDWDVPSGQAFWSVRFRQLVQPTGAELDEETSLRDILHPDERVRWDREIWPRLRKGWSVTEELRLAENGGASVWIELRAGGLLDKSGQLSRVVGFARDVTDRMEAELFKDQFIATVSHELRTPLTAIRGAVGLLSASRLPLEKQESLLDAALRNAVQLEALVGDLLDLQKLESDSDSFHFERIDLGELTRDVVAQIEPVARDKDIEIVLELGEDPVRGIVDSRRIVQAWTNLLSNAIKFSPAGSRIDVSVEVDHETDARIWKIADRGIGIPPEAAGRVFERFWQGDRGSDRSFGGSGLGLAIARFIVEMHDGTIGYEPRPGGGTVFRVDLPNLDDAWRRGRKAEISQSSRKQPRWQRAPS